MEVDNRTEVASDGVPLVALEIDCEEVSCEDQMVLVYLSITNRIVFFSLSLSVDVVAFAWYAKYFRSRCTFCSNQCEGFVVIGFAYSRLAFYGDENTSGCQSEDHQTVV